MLKEREILVEGSDHTYWVGVISEEQVVYNYKTKDYREYSGEELTENEKVVFARVVR